MPRAPARPGASRSSAAADLVRLHHRRRGWAWVAAGSADGRRGVGGHRQQPARPPQPDGGNPQRYPGRPAAGSAAGRARGRNRRYRAYSPRRYRRPGQREKPRCSLSAVRSRAFVSAPPSRQLGVRHHHADRDDRYHRLFPACRGELVGLRGGRGESGHLPPRGLSRFLHWRAPGRRLPGGDRRLPGQQRHGRHLGQAGTTGPAVQRPRSGLGLGHRADSRSAATARRSRASPGACSSTQSRSCCCTSSSCSRATSSSRRGRRAPGAGPHPGVVRRAQPPGRGRQGGGVRRPPRRRPGT